MGIPIAVLVITAFIRSLPKDLLDAASIDGASEWQIYSSLILPLVRPALATVAIFNFYPDLERLLVPLDPHPTGKQSNRTARSDPLIWPIPNELDQYIKCAFSGNNTDHLAILTHGQPVY